ncbi:MAG TPA: hypothetical protein VF885_25220 [Arthrobacter sp.]
MEYFFGELLGNLLGGLFLSRSLDRRTTARHNVLHALRLSRHRRLTADQHTYARRWLIIGARHINLFRLRRHQGRIEAALSRIQTSAASSEL